METLDCDSPSPPARLDREHGLHNSQRTARADLQTPSLLPFHGSDVLRDAASATPSDHCLLVIGAGKTAESMAKCIAHAHPHRVIVANRTMLNGQFLADRLGGVAVSLDDLPDHLAQADVVVSCTASERPILSKAVVEEAVRARRHKPLFLVDFALRGDIDTDVRQVQDVFFATVADLDLRVDDGLTDEQVLADQAQAILRWQCLRYQAWQQELTSHASVDRLHDAALDQRDRALKKACQLLKSGRSPDEVLEFLAETLTNKFMHAPSASLRAASLRGDIALMQAAERLFNPVEACA